MGVSSSLLTLLDRVVWRQTVSDTLTKYAELRPKIDELWEKCADPSLLKTQLQELTGYVPFVNSKGSPFPDKPHALANTLLGGFAGAGLGYLGSRVAENFLPEEWDKKRLRTTAMLAGGALGAAPGLTMGLVNWHDGRSFNDPAIWDPKAPVVPQQRYQPQKDVVREAVRKELSKVGQDVSGSGLGFDSSEFEEMIWRDPRVAGPLPPAIQAAASGLVSGAAALRGEPGGFVSPLDIARVAAGMGAGYTSGALVGGALGLMMGMPRKTQDTLKSTGAWAGALSQLVPVAFGAR